MDKANLRNEAEAMWELLAELEYCKPSYVEELACGSCGALRFSRIEDRHRRGHKLGCEWFRIAEAIGYVDEDGRSVG